MLLCWKWMIFNVLTVVISPTVAKCNPLPKCILSFPLWGHTSQLWRLFFFFFLFVCQIKNLFHFGWVIGCHMLPNTSLLFLPPVAHQTLLPYYTLSWSLHQVGCGRFLSGGALLWRGFIINLNLVSCWMCWGISLVFTDAWTYNHLLCLWQKVDPMLVKDL